MATKIKATQLTGCTIEIKCADCIYFAQSVCPGLKKPCSELGVKAYSRGCEHFKPDHAKLARAIGGLESLQDILQNFDESTVRLLVQSVYSATKVSKDTEEKFNYGQKVFFNLSAPYSDHLDSYYSGVVIQFLPADENSKDGYLHIAGSLQDKRGTSVILPVSEIFTKKEWEIKIRKLIKEGNTKTPKSKRLRFECSEPKVPVDYEPVSIDMVADELETKAKRKNAHNLDTFKSDSDDAELEEEVSNPRRKASKPRITKVAIGTATSIISY